MRDVFREVVLDGQRRIRSHREDHMDLLCEYHHELVRACQSPIETALAIELYHQCALDWQRVPFVVAPWRPLDWKRGYTIAPQRRIGRYVADFAVVLSEGEAHEGGVFCLDDMPRSFQARLVVECDGHAFHEKTKEQAAHDKRRDRSLVEAGWPVIRFTGSEIHADAYGCAEEVIRVLKRMIDRQAHDANVQTFREVRVDRPQRAEFPEPVWDGEHEDEYGYA